MNEPISNFEPPKRKFPKIFWSFVVLLAIIFIFLLVRAYSFSSKVFVNHTSFFSRLTNVLMHPFGGTTLVGENSGQINILLLGYGGVGHDGPYLTDSMILAEVRPQQKEVLLYSIPRDWQYKSPTTDINGNVIIGSDKINSAYSSGFVGGTNNPELGGEQAIQAVSKLTGLDIPYFSALDFSGFEKAIDQVGGVDITIDNTFSDSQYPNDDTNGYLPTVTFTKGTEHMSGQRALIFARSRHGNNGEDSDFARSKRQQKIIEAFRTKISDLNFFSDASTMNSLINILADHFNTNLEPQEIIHLRGILNSSTTKAINFNEDTGLVCQQILDVGEFVLQPCQGVTDQQIKDFFNNGAGTGTSKAANQPANLSSEKASIILENSTASSAFYNQVKADLTSAGITVYEVQYRGIPLAASVFYEVQKKPQTESYIEAKYNLVAEPKPAAMVAKSDLVLILGGQ